MTTRFIARIHHNVELWRAREIDFATFTDSQRETWAAIRAAGKQVEAEVVAALSGPALRAEVGLFEEDDDRTVQLRTASRPVPAPEALQYRVELGRTTTGSPILRISPIDPRSLHAEHRQIAAMVYELAADMERRSQQLEAHWAISPDTDNGQVVVELSGDHELDLADEFVANVASQHQLLPQTQPDGNRRATDVRRNRRTV